MNNNIKKFLYILDYGNYNINELTLYLSKQINIMSLKTLEILLLAGKTGQINKQLDITYTKDDSQTLIGNLANNPQYLALELMEYVIKNYYIDLSTIPYTNKTDSMFDYWLLAFISIENSNEFFYKRYDLIDKKLDIIEFLVNNELLNSTYIDEILVFFERCISNKYGYSDIQLSRMQSIINGIKKRNDTCNTLNIQTKPNVNIYNCSVFKSSVKLSNLDITDYYFMYVLDTIPKFIKKYN